MRLLRGSGEGARAGLAAHGASGAGPGPQPSPGAPGLLAAPPQFAVAAAPAGQSGAFLATGWRRLPRRRASKGARPKGAVRSPRGAVRAAQEAACPGGVRGAGAGLPAPLCAVGYRYRQASAFTFFTT